MLKRRISEHLTGLDLFFPHIWKHSATKLLLFRI